MIQNRISQVLLQPRIGAIPTFYKGYHFRSRLEARWAVFFDAANIKWKYETEGFQKTVGARTFRYLPDFYLPATDTWVEVKGSDEQLGEKAEDMNFFLENGCPLPGFDNSFSKQHGLLILGDVPIQAQKQMLAHRLIQSYDGHLLGSLGVFIPTRIKCSMLGWTNRFLFGDGALFWTTKTFSAASYVDYEIIRNAYSAARSARFEHGEIGGAR